MKEDDFPALYKSADALSLDSQAHFFFALKLHLILLVCAATLSVFNLPLWWIAALQLFALLGALLCSIYLFSKRPDRSWYAARAVAESTKTITWRYVCRAEPFQRDDATARSDFQQKLKSIVSQNKDVVQSLTTHLDGLQITPAMTQMRAGTLAERKSRYAKTRIKDQLTWYANKAAFNRRTSNKFFWWLIVANIIGVICASLRLKFATVPYWPTDIFVAAAASLISWMQAKRFSELAGSYALAAHEIGLIREQSLLPKSEEEFSSFVGDTENAFSREHTQWVARKDV